VSIILTDFDYLQTTISLMKNYADTVQHVRNNLKRIREGLEMSHSDTVLLRERRYTLSRCGLRALLAKNTERG
ncbi:hypothetical protein CLF_110349, partial [Clonorchis sinensis]